MTRHLRAIPDPLDQPMDKAPRGWDEAAWTRALAAARRAILADTLARETYPPTKVGYVEFNRARGRIMDELDRAAGSKAGSERAPDLVECDVKRPRDAGTSGGMALPTKEVRA